MYGSVVTDNTNDGGLLVDSITVKTNRPDNLVARHRLTHDIDVTNGTVSVGMFGGVVRYEGNRYVSLSDCSHSGISTGGYFIEWEV